MMLEKKKITRVQWQQEAYYKYQRKPQQADLSDRGQLMLRYINFMNLRPPLASSLPLMC